MKEDKVKRDYFWKVEAIDRKGKIVYSDTFTIFDEAWEKYYSFKGKNTVSLQRKFKECKVA